MRNLFFLLLILPLTSCGKSELNWLILSPNNMEGLTNLKFLLSGLTTTIFISVVSIIISIFLGLVIAIPSLAKNKFLTYWWNLPIDELEEMADENGKIKLERTNMSKEEMKANILKNIKEDDKCLG